MAGLESLKKALLFTILVTQGESDAARLRDRAVSFFRS
jgi:hypothetical protein